MQTPRKIILLVFPLIVLVCLPEKTRAQSQCVFSLQRAERLYQQGQIEEIPALLLPCIKSGFNRDERLTAYKLLIQSLLYDNRPEEAERYMKDFLKKYPEYSITPADPAEFAYLFSTYKTIPAFSVGLLLGGGFSFPGLIEQYAPFSVTESEPEYQTSGMRLRMGTSLSKYLGPRTGIDLDILFSQLEYSYSVLPQFFSGFTRPRYRETLSMLVLPVSVTWEMGKGRLKPFLRGGLVPGVFLASTLDPGRDYTDGTYDQVSGEDLVLTGTRRRNTFMLNALIGTGLRYKIPYAGSLVLDLRFEPGIRSVTNDDYRYISQNDALWRYYIIDDDLLLHQLSVSIGWTYPLYRSYKQPLP